MKKTLVRFFLFVLVSLFVFCSCSNTTSDHKTPTPTTTQREIVKATNLLLEQDSITLKVGQKKQLTAEIYPSNASDKTLVWRSSDETVATVENGTVTAVGNGTAKIIVSTGNELVQTCAVTVSTSAERIVLKDSLTGKEVSAFNMEANSSRKLIAAVLPETASDSAVSWESSNKSVATVTNDGVVIASQNGETVITATSAAGISCTCHITVNTQVTRVDMNVSSLALELGKKGTLTATVSPNTASNKTLTWKSSNPSVVSVDSGTVTALQEGTSTVTATSSNGKSASCVVSVKKIVTVTVYLSSSAGSQGEKYAELVTNGDSQFRIQIPNNPEDITTNPSLTRYFAGWFLDSGFNKPLTPSATFTENAKIYGKIVPVYPESFSYTPANGFATVTSFNKNYTTTVIVPSYINSFPVKLGASLFLGKGALKEVIILDGIPGISDSCFRDCSSLEKVILPDSIKEIGNQAFYSCALLTDINLPNGVTTIGDHAFYGCKGLKDMALPDSVTSIGQSAFYGCSGLTSITIPNGVTAVGTRVFGNCTGLTSVTVPNSVKDIGDSVFYGCTALTNIKIPGSVTRISNSAFTNSAVSTVTYSGTAAQWKAIYKKTSGTEFTVACSDGTVTAYR